MGSRHVNAKRNGSPFKLGIGCWLLVVCCRRLVFCCWLSAVGWGSPPPQKKKTWPGEVGVVGSPFLYRQLASFRSRKNPANFRGKFGPKGAAEQGSTWASTRCSRRRSKRRPTSWTTGPRLRSHGIGVQPAKRVWVSHRQDMDRRF